MRGFWSGINAIHRETAKEYPLPDRQPLAPRPTSSARLCASTALRSSLAAAGLLVAAASAVEAQTIPTLVAGNYTLSITPGAGGTDAVTISGTGNDNVLAQVVARPVQILVCQAPVPGSSTCTQPTEDAEQTPIVVGYTSATQQGPSAVAADATVYSPAGSVFTVHDIYGAGTIPNTITLSRTVTVLQAAASDAGFNSEFAMGFASPPPFTSTAFFAPGIWYNDNAWAPANAFGKFGGGASNDQYSFWRETRSGAPILAMEDMTNGLTLALAHTGAPPHVGADNEHGVNWLVGPGIQYGSLGVAKTPQTTIGFIYPADEGDGSYVPGAGLWVRRSNPVTVGFSHSYTLTLSLDQYAPGGMPSFPAAMAGTWRKFFPAFAPTTQPEPIDQIFADGLNLFATTSSDYASGTWGFPFTIDTTTGSITAIAYQMGYTGMEIPGAFQMLRAGVLGGDTTDVNKGEAQLGFWANNAVQPGNAPGLPDNIYNVSPGTPGWYNSACHPIFFRSLTDGMLGMLDAAVFMREHGKPRRKWEKFAQSFGDWLVANQNGDGSFDRAYAPDGSVFQASAACPGYGAGNNRLSTPDAIPFLVGLYTATNASQYLNAALRAGQFSLDAIYGPAIFVGGTSSYGPGPSFEPVIDREAGFQAIHAALALYDVTHQDTWLAAAREAADYAETWLYIQNYAINGASAALAVAGTRAYSLVGLIPTNSTAGIGMSIESYNFYRLHLLGDDATNHYLQVALLLENNSKLTTDLGTGSTQSYGYAMPGLVGEADDVSYLSYIQPNSNTTWLPWETEAEIEPVQRMQDTFGVSTIEAAQQQSSAQLGSENSRIYAAPGTIGWGH